MKVLSPERMARYDKYAIETWGIPSAVLMENAGRNTYRLIKERYLEGKKRIVIVCGRGNNGGDGFVVGRYALRDGYRVKVFLLCKKHDLKGDAALNMRLFESLQGEIFEIEDNYDKVRTGIKHADIIVDAIFGTGLSKAVEGKERVVIEEINQSNKPVMAVDIPSGVDGKTGVPLGCAIKAAHTFTYAYPKLGHVLCPGGYHAGKLTVIDISIPAFAEDKLGFDGQLINGEMLRGFIKERLPWSHKGTYGHVAVIAGSPGKTGAAYMASSAALKIGAGLVTLLIPESLNSIMESKLTEVMTYPVEDGGTGFFKTSSYKIIREFLENKDVIIMGPGLSQNPETMELVRMIYTEIDKPFVIDADGINAFNGRIDILKGKKRNVIFTPHPGELGRLIELSPKAINEDRINAGKRFVDETGAYLVLKGARSLFLTPDGKTYINPTGSPALAKGGSGDILTGFIGGLVSQGYTPVEASLLGVYLHGYLSDSWAETNTDMDLLAGDLLTGLGGALKAIKDGKERIYIEKSL
jgi:NAD(P)H-hydrate epimerase